MHLPMLNYIPKKERPIITQFDGINKNDVISDSELSAMTNMCMDNYPTIETRPPRELLRTVTNPQALGAGKKLFWVADRAFYYDGVKKGGDLWLSTGAKSMVDFNGAVLIFPDKKYYNYETDTTGNIGTGTYPAAGSCPDIDYVSVHCNRVFGVKGNNIYACVSGDFTNWTDFSGDALDAWAVDVYSEGDFTGVFTYANHLEIFKDDLLYELYGAYPAQFAVQEAMKSGCVSGKTVAEIGGSLLWLSREGVKAYSGGAARKISHQLNEIYSSGVAGSDGIKYYLSLYNGSTYNLYIYDTRIGKWLREDSLEVLDFAYLDGYLYALCSDGKMYKFNSGTESISWEMITNRFIDAHFQRKYTGEVLVRADVGASSSFSVYVSIDGAAYELIKTVNATGTYQRVEIPIALRRADTFQIKLTGTGEVKIYALERRLYFGSDV